MAGASWLVDSKRIATKIKSASASCDPRAVSWKSNPSRTCPRCHHVIDNSDVSQEWPGLPSGVKFDPSDQELLCHLLAKVGTGDARPHPFIDEFIPTLEGLDGICYTHPKELPGVKLDGSVSHFFHRTFKAYSTGTRKRRKIHNDTLGDVRWHKTGKTKPVVLDGIQQGCKKIMVLYMSTAKGGKPEKTNWVMHQYHLGTGEDEKDGEFVVSKVFYQQASKQNDSNVSDPSIELAETTLRKDEVVTVPKLATPEPPVEKRLRGLDSKQNDNNVSNHSIDLADTYLREDEDVVIDPKLATPEPPMENCSLDSEHESVQATKNCEMVNKDDGTTNDGENFDDHDNTDNHPAEDPKWWEGESQFLLDSQQLAEGIAICDEFLQSQSSYGGGGEEGPSKPSLSDYALMGVETLKKDLEECQKLPVLDNPDIGFDTPPDMRLSQLEFGSQDSFLAWGGAKVAD